MPRIRLAHWHDGHKPGDEIDVDDDLCKALKRDGRVAEVLPDAEFATGGKVPAGFESEHVPVSETIIPAPRKRKPAPQEE
jgi:hypothetical protein